MIKVSDFIGVLPTPPMKVDVIDKSGKVVRNFDTPRNFDLEKYVDHMHSDTFKTLLIFSSSSELNISVIQRNKIIAIYRGKCGS